MQGTALATAAALVALVVAGCGSGGGGGETATSSGGARPGAAAKGLEQAEREVERVRRERRDGGEEGGAKPKGRPSLPRTTTQPDPTPAARHHDSGGGAAQFQTKGGDNSIQEFGTEEAPLERDRAAAVLHAFLDARAAGDWKVACFYLSADTVALLERLGSQATGADGPRGCPQILATLSAPAGRANLEKAAQVDVASLRQKGPGGFLIYRDASGKPNAIPVLEEAGEWKVGGLEGTPLG